MDGSSDEKKSHTSPTHTREQAAIKANESRSRFHGNQHVEVCSPNGDHTKIKTDKELAKMAGVGTGTVARTSNFGVLEKS